MKTKRTEKERSVLFKRTEKNGKNGTFFYKERKRTERTERSFEKNGCPTLTSTPTPLLPTIFPTHTYSTVLFPTTSTLHSFHFLCFAHHCFNHIFTSIVLSHFLYCHFLYSQFLYVTKLIVTKFKWSIFICNKIYM